MCVVSVIRKWLGVVLDLSFSATLSAFCCGVGSVLRWLSIGVNSWCRFVNVSSILDLMLVILVIWNLVALWVQWCSSVVLLMFVFLWIMSIVFWLLCMLLSSWFSSCCFLVWFNNIGGWRVDMVVQV